MKTDEKFIQAVSLIFSKHMPHNVIVGTVESIDKENDTCKVTRDDAPELFKVRLNAVIDNITNKAVIYPAAGSKVLCTIIENDTKEAAIIKYSEIESIIYKIGDTDYLINATGYQIKRGNNNLKQLLNDFIAEVQKIIVVQGTSPNVAALEEIKTKINLVLQ